MSSTRDTLTQSARPTLKRKRGRPIKVEDPKDWTPRGWIRSRPFHMRGKPVPEEEHRYYHKECKKDTRRDPPLSEDIESVKHKLSALDLTDTGIFNVKTKLDKTYSADQKVLAVTSYALSGNLLTASIESGIDYPTVIRWKNKASWWPKVLEEIRRTKCEEFDLKATALIDNMLEKMAKKLMDGEGDEIVLRDGSKVKKDVDFHRLATSMSILFDKRALGRGEATSRTEKVDPKKKLDDLAKQFKDITGERVIEDKEDDN